MNRRFYLKKDMRKAFIQKMLRFVMYLFSTLFSVNENFAAWNFMNFSLVSSKKRDKQYGITFRITT